MDSQSKEDPLETEQSSKQLDLEGKDDVVQDTSQKASETGGDIPISVESGVSADVGDRSGMLGMTFKSENEAYEYYNTYARSVGFSVRKHWTTTRKKDKKIMARIFCCSSEGKPEKNSKTGTPSKPRPVTRFGCQARMRIKLEKNENFVVTEFIEEHNHELAHPTTVHLLRSQRKIQPAQVGSINNIRSTSIGATEISSYMSTEAKGSQNLNFIQSDCDNYVQKIRTEFLKKGDARLLLDYFKQKQKDDKSFFYSIQMDEDNRVSNCFWCDAKSRIDYSFFGDVVCFDTTYRMNEYDMPYAPIVGVNNHRQIVLFGSALLKDETTETFIWLFETFLDAMGGKRMKTIFTDQAVAITSAIRQVLPDTQHRLCLWHIYQNALKQLSDMFKRFNSFASDFQRCIYDNETEDEFLSCWEELLKKYELLENEWFRGLYQLREKWAQSYGQEHFYAGMTTAQRSKSMNNYFKKYFKRKQILREFLDQYEKAVARRRDKEVSADFKSRTTAPNLVSKWAVESRAAERYTRKMFIVFQEEVKGVMDLEVALDGDDGTTCTYGVSSYNGARPRIVSLVSLDHTIKCSCKKFETTGILCAHALKVLRKLNLPDLPSQYYLKRWTKDATANVVSDASQETMEVDINPSLSARYSELSHLAVIIAAKGSKTKELSSVTKCGLMRLLNKLQSYSESPLDQARPLEDINCANHDNMGEESVADHSGANITLLEPSRKKAKGQPSGRIRGTLDNRKNRNEAQSQRRKGVAGNRDNISHTMSPENPGLPPHLARPLNMVHFTQGPVGLVDQASYGPISGEWSASSSWHGESRPPNVGGYPGASSIQGLPFHQVIPSSMPLMQCVYPYGYTQGSIRPTDHTTLQHVANDTRSIQGFFSLSSQQASTHIAPPIPQSPARRLDFSESSTSE